MKTSEDLKKFLLSVDGRSYPAYKGAKGQYRFDGFVLSVDHVQGDPFAAPSRVSLFIDGKRAGIPTDHYDRECKRIAVQDYILRLFRSTIEDYNFKARGSGKSGLMAVSRCGQEVLERTACGLDENSGSLLLRMEVGFPANGRTINAKELLKIFFDFLPECVASACYYQRLSGKQKMEIKGAGDLAEDQDGARRQMKELGLVAFVADGSVLPRKSGASDLPMKQAVPFMSPSSMAVTLSLPCAGQVRGMGIREGVTLIVGGGYHGKSTLLKALEMGVYNHIKEDGRELVLTDATACKLRAEDGRSVKAVDISMFIGNLPDGRDTRGFTTEDASGSTSQAAAVMEAAESGARAFLIDEDTSATNFMVRDELMQMVVHRDKEPITPFLERIRYLYEEMGISTVLVAGSSGSYFYAADRVIQMDAYVPKDITEEAGKIAREYGQTVSFQGFAGEKLRRVPVSLPFIKQGERLKMKVLGRDCLQMEKEMIDLRFVEQLADEEQIRALGYMVKYGALNLMDGKLSLSEIGDRLYDQIRREGLSSIVEDGYLPGDMAVPRKQEFFACMNRIRSLVFKQVRSL